MSQIHTSVSRRGFVKAAFAGLGVLAAGGLAACSNGGAAKTAAGSAASESTKLTVAASPSPHAEILTKFAADKLKAEGIELVVKEYTDYIQPNKDTTSGAVDANYFQHVNYLNNYNKENKTDLVSAGIIHYEPMAIYAGKSKDLKAIADGAVFAVPNDPTNEGRALLLLQDQGLIKLKDAKNLEATPNDIAENPHNISFQEVEAAAVPRTLESVDFAVINGNYAIEAGYHVKDALAHEAAGSTAVEQYGNIICTAADKKDDKAVRALVKVLQSDDFKAYLKENFGEDVLPGF
ncbi:MetQ/NlpA family ABC transporter substrate-binding protein [Collinsella sp. zg1085]|uniref:MetQ/NlpA family ABC transporter substrate-binding protein n=1 Tax=Collinsella sp. zg1085 TaxID=2844380 RepID=UPI001C0DF8CF|nr:MetQ/NlpA family ABC transporter substrate-binding protein [Collinsella sp. zg1085]QWT17867.1 MetQ/NlpA family ABC transporter substrate-binding protein [Collinsella sp. zg1085]